MNKRPGTKRMRTAGYIIVTIRFEREGDQWAAECEQLGTVACGDTLDEAQQAIADMISLHLNALEDVGQGEAFLKKHNVKFHAKKPSSQEVTNIPVRAGQLVERYVSPVAQYA